MALSATYTPALLEDLEPLMKRPQRVMLCEESVALNAVSQFYRLFEKPPPSVAGEILYYAHLQFQVLPFFDLCCSFLSSVPATETCFLKSPKVAVWCRHLHDKLSVSEVPF
jgi:hypothetical protein